MASRLAFGVGLWLGAVAAVGYADAQDAFAPPPAPVVAAEPAKPQAPVVVAPPAAPVATVTPPLAAPENPADRQLYIDIVRREAQARGLPPEIAEAVAFVESRFQPSAVGAVGEIGLMQIRPTTAEMLGHQGGALGLFDPATNARFAVRYLAEAWKLADGDLCRALMKYRAGHGAEVISPLSATYCARAKGYLARLGSPLADGAAPDVVAIRDLPGDSKAARGAGSKKPGRYLGWRPGPHSAADNARFWAAHEARIRALEARIDKRVKLRMAKQ